MLDATAVDLVDQVVGNPDPWFPSVNVKDWQEAYRVPGTAPQTLVRQLQLAMADCNALLAAFKSSTAGAALPVQYTLDYTEAVYARAAALLLPLLPSAFTDERAANALKELQQLPGDWTARSDARLARITGASLGNRRMKAVVI
jgi:hypothetical protein